MRSRRREEADRARGGHVVGSTPALGCGFPRPRGKPGWHEVARTVHDLGARPEAGCEGASGHTPGRVCSPRLRTSAATVRVRRAGGGHGRAQRVPTGAWDGGQAI